MELTVHKNTGEDSGRTIKLQDDIFNIAPNDHVIYLDCVRYLKNQRRGTHKTKRRAEITGSRKKIKRQKGTGTARSGDIKSPIFRGGGRVFGPAPRSYRVKLNKKVTRLARKSALSYKMKDNKIKVVEDFEMETPKTKSFTQILNNLSLNDNKVLLVLQNRSNNLYLSSRNLKNVKILTAAELNTYDIVNATNVLFFESAFPIIENILHN